MINSTHSFVFFSSCFTFFNHITIKRGLQTSPTHTHAIHRHNPIYIYYMSFCTALFLYHLKLFWNHKTFMNVAYRLGYADTRSCGRRKHTGYVPTTLHVVFTFCHLQLSIYNSYYNRITPYSGMLLLYPEHLFEFTNVIMACKAQRTQWYAKFHSSQHTQRDRCTSHIATKINECEKGNANRWKEHQKLI
jgi:hypothetical protein